jgi:hypothetical protein
MQEKQLTSIVVGRDKEQYAPFNKLTYSSASHLAYVLLIYIYILSLLVVVMVLDEAYEVTLSSDINHG